LSNRNGGFASPSLRGSLLTGGGSSRKADLFGFSTLSFDGGVITGSGFKAGEKVDIHIHTWSKQTLNDAPDATVRADAMGSFSLKGNLPSADMHVTAVGKASGVQAQIVVSPLDSHPSS